MKKTRVDRDSQAERSNSLKHLSEDELLDVFETAPRRSTRDHALLIVCYQHALRASELISLKLGDIDWRNMEITIQRLKGSLRTTQPLFRMRGRPCMDEVSALRFWLNERPKDTGSDLVFLSRKVRLIATRSTASLRSIAGWRPKLASLEARSRSLNPADTSTRSSTAA